MPASVTLTEYFMKVILENQLYELETKEPNLNYVGTVRVGIWHERIKVTKEALSHFEKMLKAKEKEVTVLYDVNLGGMNFKEVHISSCNPYVNEKDVNKRG